MKSAPDRDKLHQILAGVLGLKEIGLNNHAGKRVGTWLLSGKSNLCRPNPAFFDDVALKTLSPSDPETKKVWDSNFKKARSGELLTLASLGFLTGTIEQPDAKRSWLKISDTLKFLTLDPQVFSEADQLDALVTAQATSVSGGLVLDRKILQAFQALVPTTDHQLQPHQAPDWEKPDFPLNLILYGPPGTGKTWSVRNELLKPFHRAKQQGFDEELIEEQTWWQICALALKHLGRPATVAELMAHPWIQSKYRQGNAVKTRLNPFLWNALQGHTVDSSTTVNLKRRSDPRLFDKTKSSTWTLVRPLPDELEEAFLNLTRKPSATKRWSFVTFHPSFAYEDFIEGIRPRLSSTGDEEPTLSYEMVNGVFLTACIEALKLSSFTGSLPDFCKLPPDKRREHLKDAPGYALVIDEINRGNVARILGELITLLEPDKRLGADNELVVTLPASRRHFGVPSNLYVIGTMNTADRSIEALDTALRRRFDFKECPPRPELLDSTVVDGVVIGRVLRTINGRLTRLLGPDRQLGHAHFWSLKQNPTLDELRRVFKQKVIPQLQEYFFSDLRRVGLVLGNTFVRKVKSPVQFADFESNDEDVGGELFELIPAENIDIEAFKKLQT